MGIKKPPAGGSVTKLKKVIQQFQHLLVAAGRRSPVHLDHLHPLFFHIPGELTQTDVEDNDLLCQQVHDFCIHEVLSFSQQPAAGQRCHCIAVIDENAGLAQHFLLQREVLRISFRAADRSDHA